MNSIALARRPWKLYRGWWIVITGLLALVISGGSTTYLFSVLIKPMEADLGWNRATIVGVLTVSSIVSGLLSAPTGPLYDRYGARVLMTLSACFGGMCFILVGFISAPWQFYALLGLGEAATHPALHTLGPRTAIANWFIRKRPAAFATFTTGRAISGIVLVTPIAWLVSVAHWRLVWVLMGIMELLVLVPMCWAFVRKRPEELGLLPDGEPPDTAQAPSATEGTRANLGQQPSDPLWSRSQVLRSRTYWLLTIGFMLTAFPASSIFVQMVPYVQDKGLSAAGAASVLSTYALGALFGRVVWAFIATRFGIKHALTSFSVAYGSTITAFVLASEAPALFTTAFCLGIVIGGAQQLGAQVWPDYFGRSVVGTVTGFSTIMTMPASSSSPLLAALAYDFTRSYTAIFLLYAVLCFLSATFFFLARRPITLAPVTPEAAEA